MRGLALLLAALSIAAGLSQQQNHEEVVVGTLATTPARVSLLNETLWSLVTQTRKLDAILVVYAQHVHSTEGCPPPPKWLTDYGHGVTVLMPQESWGSSGKLVPALAIAGRGAAAAGGSDGGCVDCGAWLSTEPFARGRVLASGGPVLGPDSHIITFDDDRVYQPWLVSVLLDASHSEPNAAIGVNSQVIASRGYTGERRWCPAQLKSSLASSPGKQFVPTDPTARADLGPVRIYGFSDVLIGCGGVLYKPRFFDLSLVSNRTALSACREVDDVWFSSQLERQGVHRLGLGPTQYVPPKGGIAADWSNRRGSADEIMPLLVDRVGRYKANCECALALHRSDGVWVETGKCESAWPEDCAGATEAAQKSEL